MQYKIEVLYFSGWGDAEWTEETDGVEQPLWFETVEDAQAALDKHFARVKEVVLAGNMDVEENPNHYRIVAVK